MNTTAYQGETLRDLAKAVYVLPPRGRAALAAAEATIEAANPGIASYPAGALIVVPDLPGVELTERVLSNRRTRAAQLSDAVSAARDARRDRLRQRAGELEHVLRVTASEEVLKLAEEDEGFRAAVEAVRKSAEGERGALKARVRSTEQIAKDLEERIQKFANLTP